MFVFQFDLSLRVSISGIPREGMIISSWFNLSCRLVSCGSLKLAMLDTLLPFWPIITYFCIAYIFHLQLPWKTSFRPTSKLALFTTQFMNVVSIQVN